MRAVFKRLKKRSASPEKREELKRTREEDVLETYEFLQSDEEEQSQPEDMADFIVEDDVDAGQVLRDNGVVLNVDLLLKQAFMFLREGNYKSFLNTDIIQRMFSPAYHLLASFGPGAETMKAIWDGKWRRKVSNVPIETRKDCCAACGRQRMLTYRINFRVDGEFESYDIGTDCFEIKVSPLFALVNYCLKKANCTDMKHVRKGLEERLDVIRDAPVRMARLYSDV